MKELNLHKQVAPVVPVHGGDSVQLLDGEDWAEVIRDLLQRLIVLLVDDQEGDRLHTIKYFDSIEASQARSLHLTICSSIPLPNRAGIRRL